jgi:hypothetical protein
MQGQTGWGSERLQLSGPSKLVVIVLSEQPLPVEQL